MKNSPSIAYLRQKVRRGVFQLRKRRQVIFWPPFDPHYLWNEAINQIFILSPNDVMVVATINANQLN